MTDQIAPGQISGVRPDSLAAEAGVVAGDRLLSIGGQQPRDAVDVWFLQSDSEVEATFLKQDTGREDAVVFEKEPDEDLGLEFAQATWDGIELCNNNCFFCFLKGLPRGMRKTLYVKDDDYRLSFLHGNFVTLTNLTDADWDRLADQRLSPLNVSVHATDLELRRRMLGNGSAPDVLEQLGRLASLGIQAHTQIVLTPGVNDGEQLDRTLRELTALYPTVMTVSVVPVGASPKLEERAQAHDDIVLERPTREYARTVVAQVRRHQLASRQAHGSPIVFCSDEYYLTADRTVPSGSSYDGFPQYENGVGMVRTLLDDWRRVRRNLARKPVDLSSLRVTVGTGALAAPLIEGIARELSELTGAQIEVQPVTNLTFGERVNVSGLICGSDFADALIGYSDTDLFVLPRASLDYFGSHFLDNMTPAELSLRLGAPLGFVLDARDLLEAMKGGAPNPPERSPVFNGASWSDPPAAPSSGSV